jgi:phospholipase C
MGDARIAGTTRGSGLLRKRYVFLAAAVAAAAALTVSTVSMASSSSRPVTVPVPKTVSKSLYFAPKTATPIKHVVVIFDENESFDHYFGTYPFAANTDGSPFYAKPGTPTVNGLYTKITKGGPVGPLLTDNPNAATGGFNPARLTNSEALTCDQNHSYSPEQKAEDNGKADLFVQDTGSSSTCNVNAPAEFASPGLVMDYYDGNTVTGLWNYAQNYAMSDNNYDTDYGPSTPGAVNLISGDDSGFYAAKPGPTTVVPPATPVVADAGSVGSVNSATGQGTLFGDIDPYYDDCSDTNHTSTSALGVATGKNIGDLLNAQHVTWGWFQGGFAPTTTAADSSTGFAQCNQEHQNIGGAEVTDYVPHHDPFQLYASTANPHHLPPTSEKAIGLTDQANHQYDISLFSDTLKDGNLPAVSFLKPAAYQNAHPGNSDPIDEQNFVVNTVNQIEKSKFWSSTAIVITYDDTDGWYDHVTPPVVNGSNDPSLDTALCAAKPTVLGTAQDRCGYGPRVPLIVISPYTRSNYVSSVRTDQSSVIKFIEQNWLHGQSTSKSSFSNIAGSLDARGGVLDFNVRPNFTPVILDPTTGEVVSPFYDTSAYIKKLDSSHKS